MDAVCTRCAWPIVLESGLQETVAHQDTIREWKAESWPDEPHTAGSPAEQIKELDVPDALEEALLEHIQKLPVTDESEKDGNSLFTMLNKRMWLDADTASRVSHPLCESCAEDARDLLDRELRDAQAKLDTLALMERELERLALVDGDLEMSEADKARWQRRQDTMVRDLDSLQKEQQRLEITLREHDEEAQALKRELASLEAQEHDLEREEAEFWKTYHAQSDEIEQLVNNNARLQAQLEHDREILAQLEKTSAYEDVFYIEELESGMASINGLRLGRLPPGSARAKSEEQVEWTEINAAWGQAALLLSVLMRQLNYGGREYKVVPRGSFSTVERLDDDKAVYELYGTKDWQLGRLFHSRRFDQAMVGFLSCVEDLSAHIKSLDPTFMMPYLYVLPLMQNSRRSNSQYQYTTPV